MPPKENLSKMIGSLGLSESTKKTFEQIIWDFIRKDSGKSVQAISTFRDDTIGVYASGFIDSEPGSELWPLDEDGKWTHHHSRLAVETQVKDIMALVIKNRCNGRMDQTAKRSRSILRPSRPKPPTKRKPNMELNVQTVKSAETVEIMSDADDIPHHNPTTSAAAQVGSLHGSKSVSAQKRRDREPSVTPEASNTSNPRIDTSKRRLFGQVVDPKNSRPGKSTTTGTTSPLFLKDTSKVNEVTNDPPKFPPFNPNLQEATMKSQGPFPSTPVSGMKRSIEDVDRDYLPTPTTAGAAPETDSVAAPEAVSHRTDNRRVRSRVERSSSRSNAEVEEDATRTVSPTAIEVRGRLYEISQLAKIADVVLDYVGEGENMSLCRERETQDPNGKDTWLMRASWFTDMRRDLESRILSLATHSSTSKRVEISSYCLRK